MRGHGVPIAAAIAWVVLWVGLGVWSNVASESSPLDQWDTGVNIALFGVLPQLLLGLAMGRRWAVLPPVALVAILTAVNVPSCDEGSDGCGSALFVWWVFFLPSAVLLVLAGCQMRNLIDQQPR